MDASQINFEEPPALRWQSVINEAEKQNTMGQLVPVLLARYPENAQLKSACSPFAAAEPVKSSPVGKDPVVPEGAVLVKKFEKKDDPAPVAAKESTALTIPDDEAAITIASLRIVAAETEKRLKDLEEWRLRISTMSSAKIAANHE